jgi:hypothetical protein
MKRIGMIIGLAATAFTSAFAQEAAVQKVQADAGAGGITTARFGVMGPAVKGAPYAADGVTETTQTLGDGTHINRQETYTIYRDGDGRVRRESGDQVWISDPVANASYILNTKQQTARKMGLSSGAVFMAKLNAEARAAGPVIVRDGVLAGVVRDGVLAGVARDGVIAGGVAANSEASKSEALGKQEMEGVEVDGSRTTTMIPQGQIGNDRPLQIVHERWESADLHVTILSKHIDPMVADMTERLTNVRRGEPDPALFQVPPGYAMEPDK